MAGGILAGAVNSVWPGNLSSLDADSHHFAVAYGLKFGDADLDPRRIEILEDDLCDVFGECFQQRKMAFAQNGLDVLRDIGVVQRVIDVVAETGLAVGHGNVQVELQRLRHEFFTFVDADQGGDFEFAEKDDVHVFVSVGG